MNNDLIPLRTVIDAAGGIEKVAEKLNYSKNSIIAWYYGTRTPPKAGDARARLCRMAQVTPDRVEWTKIKINNLLDANR